MVRSSEKNAPMDSHACADEPVSEMQILIEEHLVRVTSFFRDPEAFADLEKKIPPDLIENKPETYTVRVRVPGCGTGEEAYFLAVLLREGKQEGSRDQMV
jgi:two-component system, chemotaxis family, CheB/CheR fusion protein